jgi:FMN-dependent NADH-azoreductase
MKLLHVDSSILGAGSVSRELSALIVERHLHTVTLADVWAAPA